MASDPTRDVEDRLADLLDGVIGWLQFAESKTTGIVGLISTALGVIVTFLLAGPSISTLAGAGLAVGAVMLMLSLLLAVTSFLPATDLERSLVREDQPPGSGENLLFYGHLARYNPLALVRAVASHYAELTPGEFAVSKLARDLAEQIVTNARITVRKLRLYRAALLLFAAGVVIAAAAMALAAFAG
jgi:hypothetical protein